MTFTGWLLNGLKVNDMMGIDVCFHCEERHTLCHSHCERYLAEKERLEQKKKDRVRQHQVTHDVFKVLESKRKR